MDKLPEKGTLFVPIHERSSSARKLRYCRKKAVKDAEFTNSRLSETLVIGQLNHDIRTGALPESTPDDRTLLPTGELPRVSGDMSWSMHGGGQVRKHWLCQNRQSLRRFEVTPTRAEGNLQLITSRPRNTKDLHVVASNENVWATTRA